MNLQELLEQTKTMRRLPPPSERRALREGAGLTRKEVGSLLGVSDTAVYVWESGKSTPSKRHLADYVGLLEELSAATDIGAEPTATSGAER